MFEFFYGAQYYRPPTPAKEDWPRDFEMMKEANFNIVKFWPMWRWNNPFPDQFQFQELDALMNLAEEHGLKVILNPIFDTAPAWFFLDYPDCHMEDARGRIKYPRTTPSRQIGGADGACFHHPQYKKHSAAFLEAVVGRFATHPALYAWDIWNEPWLTGGFDNTCEGAVCYCKWTAKEFQKTMAGKYGSVEEINEAWARNYQSFSEVQLPRSRGTIVDNLDFRKFMSKTLTREMCRRADIVRRLDSHHIVMSHSAISTPNTDPISMANDDWGLCECLDVYGASAGGYGREEAFAENPRYEDLSYEMSAARSAARGKPVWVPESHVFDGMASHLYGKRPLEHLLRWTVQMLAGGAKGILYWQYRPELLGLESPAWGVTELDGSAGVHYEHVAKIGNLLGNYAEELSTAELTPRKIAIIYSPENMLYSWLIGKAGYLKHSMRGVFRAFYDENFSVDFVTTERPEDFEKYCLLYFPFPVVLDKKTSEALRVFVDSGGTLISEAQLGAFRRESGFRSLQNPGFGLQEVFGCQESDLRLGPPLGEESLQIDLGRGRMIQGDYARAVLTPITGEVVGRFRDETPALVSNNFGNGRAIYIGSYAGASVFGHRSSYFSSFLRAIAEQAGCERTAIFKGTDSVRVDILSSLHARFVTAVNHNDQEARTKIEVKETAAIDLETREEFSLKGTLGIKVPAQSGKIYMLT